MCLPFDSGKLEVTTSNHTGNVEGGGASANDSIIVASVELGVFGARYTHLEACAASHIYSSNVLWAASLRISSPIFLDAHIRQPPLFSVIPSQPK